MPTVLIVDDNPDIRLLMARVLETAGFAVREASGGPEALEALTGGPLPDVVTLDVQMPEVDGWDTLTAIRGNARTREVPVLMCTVKGRPEDRERGWRLGCDGYLAKPFDVGALVAEVTAACARSREEHEGVRRRALAELEQAAQV